jgi:methyl-accepting chemotaxis protein
MKNLSSLSKAFLALSVAGVALLSSVVSSMYDWQVIGAVSALIGLAAVGVVAHYLSKVHTVMRQAGEVCRAVAHGDFESRIIDHREAGDLRALMVAINSMIDRCDAYVRESAAAMQAVQANKYFRRIRKEGLHGALLTAAETINDAMSTIQARVEALENETSKFERAIGSIVDGVSTASDRMGETAGSLSAGAGTTAERATTVAAATEEATTNMQTIAEASSELKNSAMEVDTQVDQSAVMTREAVARAADAGRTIASLSTAGERIGEVAELINAIAAQTNLLALNATIEAARAGEAGKGFAVVASEVKSLANETAKATSQISEHIAEVQSSTSAAVEAISEVGRIISEVDQTTSRVADTVQAQTMATNQIASNVEQAFAGFRDVTAHIHGVTENAGETESLAKTTKDASGELSGQAQRLASEVRNFLLALRSGPLNRGARGVPNSDDLERREHAA